MAWRKWLVRGVVFSLFGGIIGAALLYQRWTNPEAVRQAVVDRISDQIPGAEVTLESAYLRLLGGIALSDLRLSRKDDAEAGGTVPLFAHIPAAVIYHDKEQLLDGCLAIRKIELQRPRFHIIRRPDGTWNLTGIFAPSDPSAPIPTVVIHNGSLLVEDLQDTSGESSIEITDVNLTLLNDPLPQVTFKGSGKTKYVGAVQLQGTWERKNDAFNLTVTAPRVPIEPGMVKCLTQKVPKLCEHARGLEGTLSLHAVVGYEPDSPRPWRHDLRVGLHEGKLAHPQVPFPLDHIEAMVRCRDGELRLERLSARSEEAIIGLSGWARLPDVISPPPCPKRLEALAAAPGSIMPDQIDLEGQVTIDHLNVGPELFAKLPPEKRKFDRQYAPRGPLNLTCRFGCLKGKWNAHITAKPQGATVSFHKFPYPVEYLTGTIEHDIDEARHIDLLQLDVSGYAGTQRIFVKGTIDGEGPRPAVDIRVWGDDLPIDSRLWAALPPQHQKLVKLDNPLVASGGPVVPGHGQAPTFHLAGKLNFQTFVHRTPGAPECDGRYVITFHHTALRYDVFPYPLEDVSGVLDIREDGWAFRDFHGTHKGADFYASGTCQPTRAGDHVIVDIRGGNVVLDAELAAALQPELKKTWSSFHPRGRMNFRAVVDCVEDQPPEADVSVTALDCSIKPDFFPYTLTDLTGNFRYSRRWVQVDHLRARHDKTAITIDTANAYIKPEGGYWVDVIFLRGSPIQMDEDLLHAVPPVLANACRELHLRDPFTLKTHLTVDGGPDDQKLPIIFWDGEVGMRDATVYAGIPIEHMNARLSCRGRYDGARLEGIAGNLAVDQAFILKQPFIGIQTGLEVRKEAPDVLVFPGLRGQIFGGEIYGPARVEFGPELKYELNLTASQIKLEEFSRQNLKPSEAVSGNADIRLYLAGRGTAVRNLTGNVTVDIPHGKLYNLPVLLDLLKFLRLRLPDRTLFEEAHASGKIAGERVNITRLDLYGNSISVRGQGSMSLEGSSVDLDFYAVWSRVLELLPPVIKELPPAISKHLLKIKMTGSLGNLRCTKEPLPELVEPLKGLLEVMNGRRRQAAGP